MNYLARAATAAVVIALVKLFLGRRSSDRSNDDASSPQSDSTPDSGDSDTVPLPIGEYEVFLNFRGPDTRNSITYILYRFLTRSKIRTFMDDDEFRNSEGIWPNLVKVICQSKISVIILSPRYAESKWCLKELTEIVEHKKREKEHIILPIFYMVDPRDVHHQNEPYEVAFKNHKRNGIDEESIQCWKAALTEVGSLKGWHIKTKETEVHVADIISGCVWSHLSKNNNKLETNDLVEIDYQVQQVEDMLELGSQGVKVVGLHGMGGIGKTTLATAVYNEVSARFDRYSFVKDIRETQKQQDAVEAKRIIRDRVTQFKILVVLDDALSNAFVSTTGGLPLTLKVIGSLLYQEEEVVWKVKLEQLRRIPEEKVMKEILVIMD
ncbi:Disease resistance protein L6 [Linum perenne]